GPATAYRPWLSVLAGLALIAIVWRWRDARAGAWSWRRTGLWMGAVSTVAWPLSAAAGRMFGLAVMPGTTGVLAAARGRPFPSWDVALVLGVLLGGAIAAQRSGAGWFTRSGASAVSRATLVRRLAGGIGLGIGASLAAGCTVGQGLTGLGILAPGSALV